ncbi:MAG: DUF1015 family protein [Clostridiales bacterium]|nr:DUF1015 family protein [Clostridiales bacterium]
MIYFNDEILIPNGDVGDFAVVACDQFSSMPEYWTELEKVLPPHSALDYVLPECFLAEADERIRKIKSSAAANDRFHAVRGTVAVTRTTMYGRTRRGIVASVDLSDYEYAVGNTALIRASERTIEERIPPRVKIREALDIELPHIMLLVDDPENVLFGAVSAAKKTTLYDGELKGGGGHIKGELIAETTELSAAVNRLIEQSTAKYGAPLFALVGDGNHSLATAKYCATHHSTPLNGRALVEIVNIYDEGLVFEPIHRLVKVDDPVMFLDSFKSAVKGSATTTIYAPNPIEVSVPDDKIEAIKAVDKFCETFVKHFGGSIEYVHGDGALKRDGHFGIKMRGMEKNELFPAVVYGGVLPKKTFSLGEAEEKRFYVEARRIK